MLELFTAIAVNLCLVLGMLLRYAPFTAIVSPKRKRVLFMLYEAAIIVNLPVTVMAFHVWGISIAINYLWYDGFLFSLCLTVANMIVIPGKTREHIFTFGLVNIWHYLLLAVPAHILSLHPDSELWAIGIYGGLLVLTYPFLRKILFDAVEPLLYVSGDSYWNTICFIPIAFLGAMMLITIAADEINSLLQLLSSMLSGVMMILMCMGIASDNRRMQEKRMLEEQIQTQKIHYAQLQAKVAEARKTKHDFKHHIAAIQHYIDADDRSGLTQYCNELAERNDTQLELPYTGNAAADGILYHYMQMAESNDIRITYSGTIKSNGIADIDLCALLGNALDNALTGCLTVPEGRSIDIVSQSEEQLLSIVVRNSFDGIVKQYEDMLLSRKRGNRPGVGISSMKSICERYGGSVEMRWDGKSFTVMFLLPLNAE